MRKSHPSLLDVGQIDNKILLKKNIHFSWGIAIEKEIQNQSQEIPILLYL